MYLSGDHTSAYNQPTGQVIWHNSNPRIQELLIYLFIQEFFPWLIPLLRVLLVLFVLHTFSSPSSLASCCQIGLFPEMASKSIAPYVDAIPTLSAHLIDAHIRLADLHADIVRACACVCRQRSFYCIIHLFAFVFFFVMHQKRRWQNWHIWTWPRVCSVRSATDSLTRQVGQDSSQVENQRQINRNIGGIETAHSMSVKIFRIYFYSFNTHFLFLIIIFSLLFIPSIWTMFRLIQLLRVGLANLTKYQTQFF